MLTTIPVVLLSFTAYDRYPDDSLHRDQATADAALAALLRGRWHRVAGFDLGGGDTVPATADGLDDSRVTALYEEVMVHVEYGENRADTWGTQALTVELDLDHTLRSRLDAVLAVCDRYDSGLFPLAHVRAAAQGRRDEAEPAAR